MARTDTLPHFLTDVADAIRTKAGTSGTIQASTFDTAISNIPSGGNISDYFYDTIPDGSNNRNNWRNIIKKIPAISHTGGCNYLFQNCPAISIDTSLINTTNATGMNRTFQYCTYLESLDISNFVASSFADMTEAFFGCSNLETISLPDFTGANPTTMSGMFGNCSKLTSVDLSTLSTPNLTNISYLFSGDSSLEFIDIRNMTFDNINTSSSSNYTQAFSSVKSTCLIIVKSQTEKDWITSKWTTLTNVKTVAEYEAE